MINPNSPDPNQHTIAEFDWPFQAAFDQDNRWVELSQCLPWPALEAGYNGRLSSTQGRPAKGARLVIGAVIIKHKLGLSDRETVCQIQENPYLQYFCGFTGYQVVAPFAPSLLVEVRKRMGDDVFEVFHQAIIEAVEAAKGARNAPSGNGSKAKTNDKDDDPPSSSKAKTESATPPAQGSAQEKAKTHQGKLIVDASVAEQAIRYPTDLSLLNEARELSEKIIDVLYAHSGWVKKPRTYRRKARKNYLGLVKRRHCAGRVLRRGLKQQLQYIRRNLGHIEALLENWPIGVELPLSRYLLYRYWVIQHLYTQQLDMYRTRRRRCSDRIVSISQPYVRPIVRGKAGKSVEFGAKFSVSLNGDGLARLDQLHWDAAAESQDLAQQVEAYHRRYGCYPEKVIADTVYGTRKNRTYLNALGIHYAGKPLGRPRKETEENKQELKRLKQQRKADYLQRIPIEGKFGQGKKGYGLNNIKAKRADTSAAWINSIFLVMNLLILLRIFFVLKTGELMKRLIVWAAQRFNQWRCSLSGEILSCL